jgi:hypothetical protein
MGTYTGRLQGEDLEPSTVSIDISDGRFRVAAGRSQLGSWPLADIRAERTSIFRFDLVIGSEVFEFTPDDPNGFSDAVGAVIDLRETKGRFGLKARIEAVTKS